MSDHTIIQQGFFQSTGVSKTLVLRNGVDWIETFNLTAAGGGAQNVSTYHYWQREMGVGDAYVKWHAAATQVESSGTLLVGGVCGAGAGAAPGFYPINSSGIVPSAPIAVTAGTNATQPVYNTANTTLLSDRAIVRVQNSAQTNLGGLDFTIDTIVAATSFRLANTLATAPGIVAGAAGTYRYIAPDLATYKLFFPGNRVISNITAASPAVVTTLVDHGYSSGQVVRMTVPASCGMTQMNGLTGTITVLTAATFSINIDATTFTAFNFPVAAFGAFTPAQVTPMGVQPSLLTVNTTDAIRNQSYLGIILAYYVTVPGASPAGTTGDFIKWRAGTSFGTFLP
jgi:hypothetical protein